MSVAADYCLVCLLVDPHKFVDVLSVKMSVFLTAGGYDRHRYSVSLWFLLPAAYENSPREL